MARGARLDRPTTVAAVVVAALVAAPLIAAAFDEPYYIGLLSRVVIFALAAVSLNLILGYGGMVSLGHAAFFGIGGYVTGALSFHAFEGSAVLTWPLTLPGSDQVLVFWFGAVAVAVPAALVIGALCLRTSGVYFIMITLAFAQMLFYLFISFQRYGGEDGLSLFQRGRLFGAELESDLAFYFVCLSLLLVYLGVCKRLVDSRFGMVIQAARQNEARLRSLGFDPYPYRLCCFVISAVGGALAGSLMVDLDGFVSPALRAWTRSGEILVMVILGGMGSLIGPVLGAAAFVFLETVISSYTEHWMAVFGPLLLLVVLFARGGLHGWLAGRRGGHG